MPLTLGPASGPGSIDQTTWSAVADGKSAASTRCVAARTASAGSGPMTRSDKVATLDEAKAHFNKSWDAWKGWAKLEGRGPTSSTSCAERCLIGVGRGTDPSPSGGAQGSSSVRFPLRSLCGAVRLDDRARPAVWSLQVFFGLGAQRASSNRGKVRCRIGACRRVRRAN